MTIDVAGAVVEIDNVEVGKAPLGKPVDVANGTHIVGAVAAGHVPVRKAVNVAARSRVVVSLELPAMEGPPAHLGVHTHLPAADVVVDGEAVARTPLAASLTLRAGPAPRPSYDAPATSRPGRI